MQEKMRCVSPRRQENVSTIEHLQAPMPATANSPTTRPTAHRNVKVLFRSQLMSKATRSRYLERTNLKRFCFNDRIWGEPTLRSTLPGLVPSWAKAVLSADLGGTIHLFTRDAEPSWFVDSCGPCRAVFW